MGRQTENVFGRSCSGEKQALAGHVFLIWKCKWRKGKLFLDFCDKSFSGKSKFVEEVFFFCFKMNTLLFCVFTFRVDYEMYSLSIWKFLFEECRFFKVNTTSWVLHSRMSDVFNGCVLLISTMICFAFFWWQEWQVLDGVAVLGHFQHCSVMRLSCLDELVNN